MVRRHPHAGGVEGDPRLEGIAVVERLSLAPLVVHLARRNPGEAEAQGHHGGHHGTAASGHAGSPREPAGRALLNERLQQEGQGQRQVRGLRVRREAEQHGRQDPSPAPEGQEAERREAHVEDLGRLPEEVDGHDAAGQDGQHPGHSRSRPRRAAQHRVAQAQCKGEDQRVQEQQAAVDADEPREGGRGQRERERLGVDEPRPPGLSAHPLQEDALRPPGVGGAHAGEVRFRELEVPVEGEAPRHRVIRRAVAPEAPVGRAGQVDRHRGQDDEPGHDTEGDPREAVDHRAGLGVPSTSRTSTNALTTRPSASAAPRRDESRRTWR